MLVSVPVLSVLKNRPLVETAKPIHPDDGRWARGSELYVFDVNSVPWPYETDGPKPIKASARILPVIVRISVSWVLLSQSRTIVTPPS